MSIFMKSDLKNLLDKAKAFKYSEENRDIILGYIEVADSIFQGLGEDDVLSPSQAEVYKSLEAAIGP